MLRVGLKFSSVLIAVFGLGSILIGLRMALLGLRAFNLLNVSLRILASVNDPSGCYR